MNENKIILLISLVLAGLVQLSVPLSMIYRNEGTIKNAKAYKFRIWAYNPKDVFRGAYINLSTEKNVVLSKRNYKPGKILFGIITEGKDDFAKINTLYEKRSEIPKGEVFFKVEISETNRRGDEWECCVKLPIKKYYINEKLGHPAEMLLARYGRANCHASVKVGKGRFVIEQLVVNGEYIEAAAKKYIKEKYDKASILKEGKQYKIAVKPIWLKNNQQVHFLKNALSVKKPHDFTSGKVAYLELEKGEKDIYNPKTIYSEQPAHDEVIEVIVYRVKGGKVYFKLLDQNNYRIDNSLYNIEVSKYAKKAGGKSAYITIRVKDHVALFEDLYIENMALHEYVEKLIKQLSAELKNVDKAGRKYKLRIIELDNVDWNSKEVFVVHANYNKNKCILPSVEMEKYEDEKIYFLELQKLDSGFTAVGKLHGKKSSQADCLKIKAVFDHYEYKPVFEIIDDIEYYSYASSRTVRHLKGETVSIEIIFMGKTEKYLSRFFDGEEELFNFTNVYDSNVPGQNTLQ